MGFVKAVKSKAKLRAAVSGPSGSGKTYTALNIAKGLGGKIALADSEFGSASKYADDFEFDTLDLSANITLKIRHVWMFKLSHMSPLFKTKLVQPIAICKWFLYIYFHWRTLRHKRR